MAYKADIPSNPTPKPQIADKTLDSRPSFRREDEDNPLNVTVRILQGRPVTHELLLPPALSHLALELVAGAGAEVFEVRGRRRGVRGNIRVSLDGP